jgi:hypothetical protein
VIVQRPGYGVVSETLNSYFLQKKMFLFQPSGGFHDIVAKPKGEFTEGAYSEQYGIGFSVDNT